MAEPCLQSFWCWVGLLLFFSHQVVSISLWPHGLQHIRLPCPLTICRSLLKFMSIELVMPSNHLILCSPLLLLPSIFPSLRVFSNKSALHIRWPSIGASALASGLISFRIDCFDLLVVWGTLKNLLQDHSLKASILQHLTFFMVSHTSDVRRLSHFSPRGELLKCPISTCVSVTRQKCQGQLQQCHLLTIPPLHPPAQLALERHDAGTVTALLSSFSLCPHQLPWSLCSWGFYWWFLFSHHSIVILRN